MTNLGGHDLPSLLEAFEQARTHDRPVCFIAYTIKGFGLPLAGHKDNHAGLMTPAQMEALRQAMQCAKGHEWEPFEGLDVPGELAASSQQVRSVQQAGGGVTRPRIDVPDAAGRRGAAGDVDAGGLRPADATRSARATATSPRASSPPRPMSRSRPISAPGSTGAGCSRARRWRTSSRRSASPRPSTGSSRPKGQHLELGIAEMNLFIMLSALGLSHSIFGERLLPVGTLYDPFIERGLDALNYACYQDARFILAATPSGVTLAPEGGAHQSIATPLIGMAQDGLASFEPAFVDELADDLALGLRLHAALGRGGAGRGHLAARRDRRLGLSAALDARRSSSRSARSTRARGGHHQWRLLDAQARPQCPGGRRLYGRRRARRPSRRSGCMAEDRRDVGLLAVTSADRLNAGWTAAQRARERGLVHARSHIERLLADVPAHCGWSR